MGAAAAELHPAQAGEAGGEGSTPLLALEGFSGTLERLLKLARAQQVDLAQLSLPDLCDQLSAALQRASGTVPLGRQGDWVVMGAWLVQLRSGLLLPLDEPSPGAAHAGADQPGSSWAGSLEMRTLAAWLEGRPQLGRDMFARGQPEWLGAAGGAEHQVDVIEFLWASLAVFDADLPAPGTTQSYRPVWLDLYSIGDARDRIRRLLAGTGDGRRLDQLLPAPAPDAPPLGELKRRSRWTSTFVASLELARQGEITLEQEDAFAPIHVRVEAVEALSAAE